MVTERSVAPAVWIDILSPSRTEIRKLLDEKKIPVGLVDEIIAPSDRPEAIMTEGVLFAVFHLPKSHKDSHKKIEIDFIVGRDYVVTVHHEPIQALEHFAKLVEVENITDHKKITASNGPLLFSAILTRIYETIYDELEVSESAIKEAEEHIFAGHEKKMVLVLSHLSRLMLNFKKTLDPHENLLKHISELVDKNFGEAYKISILNSYEKVRQILKSEGEIVQELQDTNSALLSTKQNEIMKTLTTVIFLTTPATIIAAIFTIPAKHIPIIDSPNDFLILMGSTAIITLILLFIIKVKKWI